MEPGDTRSFKRGWDKVKTRVLLAIIEELGFSHSEIFGKIYVESNDGLGKEVVASVKPHKRFSVNTGYGNFELQGSITQKLLFDALMKYSETPINERESVEKFYLKFDNKNFPGMHYTLKENKQVDIHTRAFARSMGYKQTFTEEEIEGMDITGFIREPEEEGKER